MNLVKSMFKRAVGYNRGNIINQNYPINIYNCLLCVGGCVGLVIAGSDFIVIKNDRIIVRHPYIIPLYVSRGILVAAVLPLLILRYLTNMIYKREIFNYDQELLDLIELVKNSRIFKKNIE